MKFQGKIINWNDDRGFGFVEPNGGGNRAFVHIKSFNKCSRRPLEGDLIVYEEIKEPHGKFKAKNISLVADRHLHKKPTNKSRRLGSVFTGSFCIVLTLLVLFGQLHFKVLLLYVVVNLITFILYWVDKSAAQNNRWRTPESQLHLFSLIGGWPGAFYAQNKLRHKSSKSEFKSVYWVTVAINFCGFLWLFSDDGQLLFSAIVG